MATPEPAHHPAFGSDAPGSAAGGVGILVAVSAAVLGVSLLAGLLLALLVPEDALISQVLGTDASRFARGVAIATGGVLGGVEQLPADVVGSVPAPGLALVAGIAGALAAAVASRRAADLAVWQRALWAAAAAIPVAAGMAFAWAAVRVLDVELSLGSILVGSVLLVPLGGCAGVVLGERRAARREGRRRETVLPPAVARWFAAAGPAVWALAGLAVVATAVGYGNAVAVAATLPLPDGIGDGRGLRILNLTLAIPDISIAATALTLMAGSERAFFALAPVTDRFMARGGDTTSLPDGPFVVFASLNPGIALLEVLLLLAAMLVAGLAAGFAAARRAGARNAGERIAAGALVGPVWLLILPTLGALTDQGLTGSGRFVGPLLLGSLLGVAGALLSVLPVGPGRLPAQAAAPAEPPPREPWSRTGPVEAPAPRTPAPPPPRRPPTLWGSGGREE